MVRWIFEFSEVEKERFKKLVPEDMYDNPFLQRMYFADPEMFEKLAKKKLGRVFS